MLAYERGISKKSFHLLVIENKDSVVEFFHKKMLLLFIWIWFKFSEFLSKR